MLKCKLIYCWIACDFTSFIDKSCAFVVAGCIPVVTFVSSIFWEFGISKSLRIRLLKCIKRCIVYYKQPRIWRWYFIGFASGEIWLLVEQNQINWFLFENFVRFRTSTISGWWKLVMPSNWMTSQLKLVPKLIYQKRKSHLCILHTLDSCNIRPRLSRYISWPQVKTSEVKRID